MKKLVTLLVLASCAPAPAFQSSPPQSVVTDRLYFGRNIGNAFGVTDSAWGVFVREVLNVRLPGGFTFWSAEGGGHEPSFVLEVVHPVRAAATDSAIVAIINEYKRRFRQESVLRVLTPGTLP